MSNSRAQPFDCSAARGALRAARLHASRVVRLALPQHCELCVARTDGDQLCAACAADLPRIAATCPVCALPSPGGRVCGGCLAHPPPFAATLAALIYAFPTDRLLQRIKYGGRLALADCAGTLLAAAVAPVLARRAADERPAQIVALPLANARQRQRGFNQALEIAARVARATALPLVAPLARITDAPPQAGLPWAQRRRNVRGAFAVHSEVRGARIALVDDVMTTGATLADAAAALKRAGAARVECWVVARTLPPDAPEAS